MPTGACGINCDVCGLNIKGICSTCGSGKSVEGKRKLDTQINLFGAPCPLLGCAIENRIVYCPRDCDQFPCDHFKVGPYPYSQGYLSMQERRRVQTFKGKPKVGDQVDIPVQYWEELEKQDREILCENSLAKDYTPRGLLLPFLKEYVLVDTQNRTLCRPAQTDWERIDDPLLELICLVYLLKASPMGLQNDMVSVNQLKSSHFFTGPHAMKIQPLIERFGYDLEGFKKVALRNQGESIDLADVAYRFEAFPKVPLYYLLWVGDDEFQPRLSVLFDRSVEYHLAPDAIWGLVTLVSDRLLYG